MKKLIALCMISLCLVGFSIGCGGGNTTTDKPVGGDSTQTTTEGDKTDGETTDTPATPTEGETAE